MNRLANSRRLQLLQRQVAHTKRVRTLERKVVDIEQKHKELVETNIKVTEKLAAFTVNCTIVSFGYGMLLNYVLYSPK